MRFTATLIAASLALAACTSSSSPTPPPAPPLSKATQRYEAQASIAVANGIQAASLIAIVLKSFHVQGERPQAQPVCKNGVETTITVVSPEQTTVVVDAFYDPHCRTLLTHANLDVTLFPSGHLTMAGNATTYSTSRKPVAYATISTKGSLGATDQATTTGSISLTPTGPAVLAFGLSCTLSATNSCGFGGIATVTTAQALGVSSTLNGFVISGTNTGKVALRAYQGAPGALKLVRGAGNSWAISGGTLAATQAGSFVENVDPSSLNVSGTLALSDSLAGASTAGNFGTRTGIGNGAVSQTATSKQFATYSSDAVGSGTIGYSDGSTGNIVLFIIVS
ncbi:MAG: hypothetical protein JO092_03880 [Candidatus Eremiobacteraeota bacterium]|nr:hypothetical protein [Candidatus Eremiobacteraeota bacterium]